MLSHISAALLAPGLGNIYILHWLGCMLYVFVCFSLLVLQYVFNQFIHTDFLRMSLAGEVRGSGQCCYECGYILLNSGLTSCLGFPKCSKDTESLAELFEESSVTFIGESIFIKLKKNKK